MSAPPIPQPARWTCPTRYAETMTPERTLFTTAEVALMLGLSPYAIKSAIRRGTLESVLASPHVRLISQAAIDTYRQEHLGHVGRPARKKRRKRAAPAAPEEHTPAHAADPHHTIDEGGAIHPPEEDDDGHDPRHP